MFAARNSCKPRNSYLSFYRRTKASHELPERLCVTLRGQVAFGKEARPALNRFNIWQSCKSGRWQFGSWERTYVTLVLWPYAGCRTVVDGLSFSQRGWPKEDLSSQRLATSIVLRSEGERQGDFGAGLRR